MNTQKNITGLHHVTAVCGDPQVNYAFYVGTLGLRLVKKTVNFDDPGTYHLYYGDGAGTPGSIMTFFPWMGAPDARDGTGTTSVTSFAIAPGSLEYWQKRLADADITVRGPMQRFDEETYIEFSDPDGLRLELVVTDQSSRFVPWAESTVPTEHQLQGFHSVTLSVAGYELTHNLLTEKMGWSNTAEKSGRFRYTAPEGSAAVNIDVLCQPGARHSLPGKGSVHHIAFRVADDATQLEWRELLVAAGYNLSPVMDRNYFHSIYYREPSGILFEIATDPPGFDVDEPAATMGAALMLPSQYESYREQITAALPPLVDTITAS